MRVTKEAIERVRQAHDLVEVVRSHGVKLARKGRNWVGLCPFHEDHEPSLVVNPSRQLWNCFGACKAKGKSGGDVFAFVAKAEGVTFVEALKRLGYEEPVAPGASRRAPRAAAPERSPEIVRSKPSPPPETRSPAAPNRAALLGRVAAHYHRVFRERPEGQEYLERRGLTDAAMLAAFQVGYADGTLRETLTSDLTAALKELGILNARGRELLAGCVVFPLSLPDAGVVGLYGRHVTRDQHLYLPGPRRGVFHWQALKGSEEVLLAESVIDALTLYQAGFRNVVAIYGTQGFTADHEDLLQRFRVKRVGLLLDNDEAGHQATHLLAQRIGKLGIEVADVRVAGAKDPNALFAQGAEAASAALRARLREAFPLTGNRTGKEETSGAGSLSPAEGVREGSEVSPSPAADRVCEAGPDDGTALPTRPGGVRVTPEPGGGYRVAFAERAYRVRGLQATGLDRLKVNLRIESAGRVHLDTLDLYSHRARTGLVLELARLFAQEEEALAREVASLVETLEALRLERGKTATTEPARLELADRERDAALRLLRAPDLLDRIVADFDRMGCVGEETALLAGYLGTVSRLLAEPLGLLIVSRSGAGKSRLQDALCDVVPEEDLVRYTRLTGQALFYKEEDSLAHKVLALDEEEGAQDAAYSIRNLQSAQVLSVAATRTDPQTGKLKTEEYRVKGPVFILFTTTSPEALDYETRNRFVQVGIDESAEQTRRILERQRQADTLDGVLGREEAEHLRTTHRNVQRLLRPLKVVNPYASLLTYPDDRLPMRREQKKYLTLMKTIALLHQHQREVKRARRGGVEVEYVEVEPGDIALANRLAVQVLGRSLDELAQPTRLLLTHLVEMVPGPGPRLFTRKEVRDRTGWTDWQVRVHLQQLVELEYAVVAAGRKGKRLTYELLYDGDPEADGRYLGGLVDVEALLARQAAAKRNGDGLWPRAGVAGTSHLVSEPATS